MAIEESIFPINGISVSQGDSKIRITPAVNLASVARGSTLSINGIAHTFIVDVGTGDLGGYSELTLRNTFPAYYSNVSNGSGVLDLTNAALLAEMKRLNDSMGYQNSAIQAINDYATTVNVSVEFPLLGGGTTYVQSIPHMQSRVDSFFDNPVFTGAVHISGNLTTTGNAAIGQGTAGNAFLEVGDGRTTDGACFLDLIGDTTYLDYGVRLIRNPGADGGADLATRGAGRLKLVTQEHADLVLATNSVDRAIINGVTGNVSVGTASANSKLGVVGSSTINAKANIAATFKASVESVVDTMLALGSTNGTRPFIAGLDGPTKNVEGLDFYINSILGLKLDASLHFTPGTDNSQTNGAPSYRWSEFFVGNGTINTSDEKLKTDILEIEPLEKEALLACVDIIGKYQMLDSVEAKGADGARWHFGLGAQSAIREFTKRGLDWSIYSMFCCDEIDVFEKQTVTELQQATEKLTRSTKKIEIVDGVPVQITQDEEYESLVYKTVGVVDEDGEPVMHFVDSGEKKLVSIGIDEFGNDIIERQAIFVEEQLMYDVPEMIDVDVHADVKVGTTKRYGIRYEQLICAIIAALPKKL